MYHCFVSQILIVDCKAKCSCVLYCFSQIMYDFPFLLKQNSRYAQVDNMDHTINYLYNILERKGSNILLVCGMRLYLYVSLLLLFYVNLLIQIAY